MVYGQSQEAYIWRAELGIPNPGTRDEIDRLRETLKPPTPTRTTLSRGVCDNCLDAASDVGAVGAKEQGMICRMMGADIPDHTCDLLETDSTCGCACLD